MDAAGTSRWIGGGRDSIGQPRPFEPARLLRAAVALGMGLLALAGVVLLGRKMSGALVSPPSAAALAGVGLMLAAAGLVFRWLLGRGLLGGRLLVESLIVERTVPERLRPALHALPSVVSVLWLAALSLPQTSGWALLLLFGPVLLAEGWSWGRFARQDPAETVGPELVAPLASHAAEASPSVVAEELADAPLERDENTLGEQTRRRDDEAGEVLEGWLRVEFAAGQRHAAAHVAICPPLERNPTCYAEPVDGPDAGVKVTQAMSYGVRLEVKLAEPAEEPASVIVEYSILEHAAEDE